MLLITDHKGWLKDVRIVATIWILVGVGAAIALFEVGFFTSLILRIPLPDITLRGIITIMARGCIVACVFTLAIVLLGGLVHKAFDYWIGDLDGD